MQGLFQIAAAVEVYQLCENYHKIFDRKPAATKRKVRRVFLLHPAEPAVTKAFNLNR